MEQMFDKLGEDRYFLNMLKPANCVFVMRLLLHLHNERITTKQVFSAAEAFRKFQAGAAACIGTDYRLYISVGK